MCVYVSPCVYVWYDASVEVRGQPLGVVSLFPSGSQGLDSRHQASEQVSLPAVEFFYIIKGNEMFVTRKDKSITRASVMAAFGKALELGRVVTGPKKLGTFGASYLYL